MKLYALPYTLQPNYSSQLFRITQLTKATFFVHIRVRRCVLNTQIHIYNLPSKLLMGLAYYPAVTSERVTCCAVSAFFVCQRFWPAWI